MASHSQLHNSPLPSHGIGDLTTAQFWTSTKSDHGILNLSLIKCIITLSYGLQFN